MGLFSFLSSKAKPSPVATVNHVACDPGKTTLITELLQIPEALRGDTWLREFYDNVKTAEFTNGDPETLTGPDGFTYFKLHTHQSDKHGESFCLQNMKDDFLMDKGFGVVINPSGNKADWVFSHGDIVNLYLNNEFVSDEVNPGVGNIEMTKKVSVLKKGEEILMAQPSEKYLPKKTRIFLKSFLQSKGVKRPMVMLLCRKNEGVMMQQLAFNVFSEDFPANEQEAILQRITWFLPRHYSIISLSKSSEMTKNFDNL